MLLALLSSTALAWGVLICALVAIVARAAVGGRLSYVKCALVGVGVGVVFAIAIIYVVDFLGAVSDLFASLTPDWLDPFASGATRALVMTGAAALTATTVGALATRSVAILPRYAIVGAAFGLVLSIATTAAALIGVYAALPAMEAAGLGRPSPLSFGAAMVVVGVLIDITLAVVAFRLIRGNWTPAFADDAA